MMDWAIDVLQGYWPAILILLGIGCLLYGVMNDEIAVGIMALLFYGGLGVLFFIRTPGEVWSWLSQYEVIRFLFEGRWYEVVLKVTGAIGAIGLAIRVLVGVLRGD